VVPETREKGVSVLGRKRGGSGRQATQSIGRERSWGLVIVSALAVAFLGAFVVVVVLDARQQAASSPPGGVENINVGPGGQHTEGAVDYAQNPPAGGKHNLIWQNAGFYDEPVRNETAVHTLEHGAIWFTYSPDLPQADKQRIRELATGQNCVLVSPYPNLDAPVVASAWGKQLALEGADDPDLMHFVSAYKQGPQRPEPNVACTGGLADPA
jgi:Protein of unknown function (DUF3105)